MADDAAKIEITASTSRLDAGLRQATAQMKKWAVGIKGVVGKGGGALGSTVASSIGNIVGAAASKGMDFVADQARSVKTFEESLVRLGIAGNYTTDQLDELRNSATKISTRIGLNRQEILEGAQSYVDLTGDVDGAAQSMEMFSRIAQASGAKVSDVATAAASFKMAGIDLKTMEGTFSGLIQQGKAGAVSLKDFAGELSAIMPRWAKLGGGTSAKGVAEMGAAFQIVRKGFGSASEAATGIEAFLGAMKSHAFQKTGIKVFNEDPKTHVKTLKSLPEILEAIEKSKLVKDPALMQHALGRKEAEQAVSMLLQARQAVGGVASEYDNLVQAGMDAGAVQRDLDTYMNSSAGRMSQTWEGLKNAIAEAFTPERIEAFVEMIEKVASAIGTIIDGLSTIKDNLTGKTAAKANPFEAQASDQSASWLSYAAAIGGGGGIVQTDKATKAAISNYAMQSASADPNAPDGMKKIEASRVAYNEKMSEIEGQGTRAKRLRAAVEAMTPKELGGQADTSMMGGAGRKEAGTRYIAAEGAKSGEIEKIMGELWKAKQDQKAADAAKITEQNALIQKIADVIQQGFSGKQTNIAIDGNHVATAVDKSTNARRKP